MSDLKEFLEEESAEFRAEARQRRETLKKKADELRAKSSTPKPRTDTGELERLATFQRPNGELRVGWHEYEGHPFVSVRVWTPDESGTAWLPSKAGVSVKLRELADFAQAVERALDLLDAGTSAKA